MKIMWGGLVCFLALAELLVGLPWEVVGTILMVVGYVLYLFDK